MRPWLRLVPASALVAVITAGGSPANPGSPAARVQAAPKIDVGRIAETVSHHVAATKRGTLLARDRLYRAEFDARGLSLRFARSRFRLDTVAVERGSSPLPGSPRPWHPKMNRVERELAPGLTERF